MDRMLADRQGRFAVEGRLSFQVTAAIGRRQLRRMARAGLPDFVRDPLEFLLTRRLAAGGWEVVERIEELRARLAARSGEHVSSFDKAHDAGAGRRRPDERVPRLRSLSEVAHVSSVAPLWGAFLYLCAASRRARTILEFGAGAGISGCYLASSPDCRRFITVEGDPCRAALARENLAAIAGDRFELIVDSFEAALGRLLPDLGDGIDLVYSDGGKTRGSHLEVLERVCPRLSRGAVIVLDDIQWSELWDDWTLVCSRPGVSFAVNAGRFGVCVWEGGAVRPQVFTLYELAGIDLYRARRNVLARLRGGRREGRLRNARPAV